MTIDASQAVLPADALLAPWLAQAARQPQAPALVAAGTRLDHAALAAALQADVARLRAAGIGAGDIVAIDATRSPAAIQSLLAILAAGAACLPLDPGYPRARLEAMLALAQPQAGFGDAEARARLPEALRWIERAGAPPAMPRDEPVAAGELAYVLFTSGSSGEPKGVAMRRLALAPLLAWHRAHPRLGRAARTLQFAPLGFDVSFQEILSTLTTGGTLVLPEEAERRDPYALLDLLEREAIERLFLPYVGLQALAEAVAAGGVLPRSLRDVVTAGEQLRITPAIRALFRALPGAVLHNHYGPTETHVVTAHELAGNPAGWPELPPIGQPLPHARVRVVDEALRDTASEGELLLGGGCLAAGYIRRPDLTAERFIMDEDARWYRTGDRVRRAADGTLEYLGRLDAQLKLDGFRIEPAEIEAVLARHADVAEAVVVAAGSAGTRRLEAHVVARDATVDEPTLAARLAAHARALLPDYMVPRTIRLHAALPLTASGKIDRRALAAAGEEQPLPWPAGEPLPARLLALWRHLLDAPALAAADNLFEHGARSLLVVRALTELRRHGHVMSVAQAWEHPSVAAQAALLDGTTAAAAPAARDAAARGQAQRAALARFGPRGGGR